MSNGNLESIFTDLGCFPHQAEFAAKFLSPNAERKHLLTSLPGLGKGFMGSAIVGYAAAHGLAQQVIVLAPTALVFQWREMIRRASPDVPCTIVDRRRLRELQASDDAAIWRPSGVVLMSIDFAKREDVADVLGQSTWDMLVVDESHQLTPKTHRYLLVSSLLERSPSARVLFLHTLSQVTEDDVASNPLFSNIAKTVWSRETVKDKDGRPLLPEVRIEWIRHQRRADEARVLSQLQEALQASHVREARSQLEAATLLQSASSSLFALEQRLNRMRRLRNEIAHGLVESLPGWDDGGLLSDDLEQPREGQSLAQSSFAQQIGSLLEQLDEVDTDSKFESLLELLDTIGVSTTSDRRVCVFTSYVDTATYLESALGEHDANVSAISGTLSFDEREHTVGRFTETGGILISTSAMKTRIPEVAAVIFYDLPLNPATLDARIGQFLRVGRTGPVHVYAFTDESDTLGIERLQRKAIEIKQAVGSDEVQKLLFEDGA